MSYLSKHWEVRAEGKDPIEATEKVIAEFKKQSTGGWWSEQARAIVTDLWTMKLTPFENSEWMAQITFDLEYPEKRMV